MKLLNLFVLIVLLYNIHSLTAHQNMTEIVYLKNGSVIKCIVIEQNLGKNIKIQTSDGSIYVYTYDQIEKIEKITNQEANNNINKTQATSQKDINRNPLVYFTRGYLLIPNIDDIFGLNYLSLKLGKVITEKNFIRFGMEYPVYYYEGGYSSYPYFSLILGYEYYLNSFVENSFFATSSLDYNNYKNIDPILGFSLGLGYSFKLPSGNLGLFIGYSYHDETFNTINIGMTLGYY